MRHTFRFAQPAREALKKHVSSAIGRIDPKRYNQEHSFMAVLVHELEGVVYDEKDGYIEFKSTDVNHIGPKSTESWSGADIAITALISNDYQKIRKAILIQAKRGNIKSLPNSEMKDLRDQIQKMKKLTRSPKVFEILDDGNKRYVNVVSGNRILQNVPFYKYDLGDYFIRRVLTTFDGDTRPTFVDGVQESSFSRLDIHARTKSKNQPYYKQPPLPR